MTTSEPFISLLASSSPSRKSVPSISQSRHNPPSIPGRAAVRSTVALAAFLDAVPHEQEHQSSDTDNENEHHFDERRKKVKRRAPRIARPRDSMPGFGKRRYGRSTRSRSSNSRFPSRSAGASGHSGHLDRGITSASYYGDLAHCDDAAHTGDHAAALQLRQLETQLDGAVAASVPRCLVHAELCVSFVCKKPGKNKGREFFKCGKKQRYEQCDFFQWADEAPELYSDAENTDEESTCDFVQVPPVFDLHDDNEKSLTNVLRAFGHDAFRAGQLETLQNLLCGTSSLALLPTGGGKSLIYQTFAAVRSGIVVVVTPLVSLMLDQLSSLPDELPGACIRSGQTLETMRATEQKLRQGKIKVLFISPERLFSSRFCRLMNSQQAPNVSLVVIDEAHCISQWSHNFRTAYLRIPLALFGEGNDGKRAVFKQVPQILALTATATAATAKEICDILRIDCNDGVVRVKTGRDNLSLSLSRADATVDGKAHELVKILKMRPFSRILGIREEDEKCLGISQRKDMPNENGENQELRKKKRKRSSDDDDTILGWGSNLHLKKRVQARKRTTGRREGSLIVYVTKQKDCGAVSNYLKSSGLGFSGDICMYHAGLPQKERTKVQNHFQRGSVAILVATVAFGMGLDYSNVSGVIHFDMPSSLESYWQEIGRAGRDGREAFCHVFFNKYDGCRILSRSHADGVDRSNVRQFLRNLVANCFTATIKSHPVCVRRRAREQIASDTDCETNSLDEDSVDAKDDPMAAENINDQCGSVILSLGELTVLQSLDVKKETAETICALLESEVTGFRMRGWSATKLRLRFFSKSPSDLLESKLKSLTYQDRKLLEIVQNKAMRKPGHYDLDLPASSVTEGEISGAMQRLQAGRHISFETLEQGLQVECTRSCFKELQRNVAKYAERIHTRLENIRSIRTRQAQAVVNVFSKADLSLTDQAQSALLHKLIHDYLDPRKDEAAARDTGIEGEEDKDEIDEETRRDVDKAALTLCSETSYGPWQPRTGRQIARILHGIDSARFRAKDWWRCRQWGQFVACDFEATRRVACEILRGQHMCRKQNK